MESFGQVLRSTREAKSIDLDKAARETNISRRYLECLEDELLSMFPGEPYLIGFLRNYCEYLELDSKKIIAMYRSAKIQESPVPQELLHEPKRKIPLKLILGIGIPVTVLLIAGIVLYAVFFKDRDAGANIVVQQREAATYRITNAPIKKRLYKGDKIEVPLSDGTIILTVGDTLQTLTLQTPAGNQIIDLGEEVELNLDSVPGPELTVFLSDVSKTDAERGAEVQMMLSSSATLAENQPVVNVEEIPLAKEVTAATSRTDRTVIFEGNTAYPFTLNATYRGPCLFRYESDRKDRIEDFFSTGDTLVMQANNGIRVWMSNANAVKLQIIAGGKTVELEAGRPGQVLVRDVKWIKDDDGKFKLVVLPVD